MEKITLYFYTDPETHEYKSTLEPMSLTCSQPKFWLTANEGCYLRNEEYNISCKSIIIPTYELKNWEERQL
jgi:hypothetical protein